MNLSFVDCSSVGRTASDCASELQKMPTRPAHGNAESADLNFASLLSIPVATTCLTRFVMRSRSWPRRSAIASSRTMKGEHTMSSVNLTELRK